MKNGVVVTVLGLAVIAAFIIVSFRLFPEPPKPPQDPEIIACLAIVPQTAKLGIDFKSTGSNEVLLTPTASRESAIGLDPKVAELVVKCLLERGRVVKFENVVRLPLEPVGQTANRWSRESGGPALRFVAGANDPPGVLYNLQIGPAVGQKAQVVRNWCGTGEAGGCVTCSPADFKDDIPEVVVRLKESPPVVREQMEGTWPIPQLDQTNKPTGLEPWQLVDVQGKRWFFACKPSE
jgi:hypothetical protein